MTKTVRSELQRQHKIQIIGDSNLGSVCFKVKFKDSEDSNRLTLLLCDRISEIRKVHASEIRVKKENIIRVAVGAQRTTEEDVREMCRRIKVALNGFMAEYH
ncbi:hypothetical protein L596_006778 [Steinernema carpocapsae]|uniref:Aminotransferase class I/classII domain-containing protein n=1 Tax=Steinernema carpocapsae TaxID=34508 RepID=A0A4U5P6R9_STECR|nr:hypothetical protein L596_006778 [Steinernema carpocapsae]